MVTIIPIGETLSRCYTVATALRHNKIRTRVDTSQRKLRKKLTSLSNKKARFVILIGEDEAETNTVKIKDLKQSKESGFLNHRIVNLC